VTSRVTRPRLSFWLLPLPLVAVFVMVLAQPALGARSFYPYFLCLLPLMSLAVLGALLYALRHVRHEPRTALLPLVVCAGGAWLLVSGTAGHYVLYVDFAVNRGLREEVVALVQTGQLGPEPGTASFPTGRYQAVSLPLRYRTAAPHGHVFVERTGNATYVLFPRTYDGSYSLHGFLYRSDGASSTIPIRGPFPGETSGTLQSIEQLAPGWFLVQID
jgi:hypothetical protein